MKFISLTLILCALLVAQAIPALPEPFPPERPDSAPDFDWPAVNSSLDEPWLFVDTLLDASPGRPDLFSAYPVDMVFGHEGNGYLALLHTVYRTSDAGQSWFNMDPSPPPGSSTTWGLLRSPNYISDIALRPSVSATTTGDSVFIASIDGDGTSSELRVIRWIGGFPLLRPEVLFDQNVWMTDVTAPENHTTLAFAGLDGMIFREDTVEIITIDSVHVDSFIVGDSLIYDTSFISFDTTYEYRWDTLDFNYFGNWINDVEVIGERVIAAGSGMIVSEDGGRTWATAPAIDPDGVLAIDFAPDELHGLACGGGPSSGWVRYTDDGGATWSERVLSAAHRYHAVHMVTSEIGFAAGGNVDEAVGYVFRTDNGGETWVPELFTEAEMRVVNSTRQNGATVNVIAAGVFPDFSGGLWRSPLFAPVEAGPVIVPTPDTLRFGDVPVEGSRSLELSLENIGNSSLILTAMTPDLSLFSTDWLSALELLPGQSTSVTVTFSPDTVGEYEATLYIQNSDGEDIRVPLLATSGLTPVGPGNALLPNNTSLSVWPNPGNAEFRIGYDLSHAQEISLRVFDVTGRVVAEIASGVREPGEHTAVFEGLRYASGLYFVRLETSRGSQLTKKLMLVK